MSKPKSASRHCCGLKFWWPMEPSHQPSMSATWHQGWDSTFERQRFLSTDPWKPKLLFNLLENKEWWFPCKPSVFCKCWKLASFKGWKPLFTEVKCRANIYSKPLCRRAGLDILPYQVNRNSESLESNHWPLLGYIWKVGSSHLGVQVLQKFLFTQCEKNRRACWL